MDNEEHEEKKFESFMVTSYEAFRFRGTDVHRTRVQVVSAAYQICSAAVQINLNEPGGESANIKRAPSPRP